MALTKDKWKTTKLPPAMHSVIKSEAAKLGVSMTDLIEIIFCDWLRRQGAPVPPLQNTSRVQLDLMISGGIAGASAAHDRRATDTADFLNPAKRDRGPDEPNH